MLISTTFYPQKVWAEGGFKNKDFLTLTSEQKLYWLDGAIRTLIHMATAKNSKIGQCVNDWYADDLQAQRNGLIEAYMKKYPDNYPSSVLLALTEKACGTYRK